MLGWAAEVTVLAVVALVALVAVVAEPALVAKVALATAPVTLPPGIDDSPAPDPLNWDAVTVPVALTNPAVRMLPPMRLPIPTDKLPPVMLLLAAIVPDTVNPVLAKTPTLVTPLTLTSTVSLGLGICTELVPLAICVTDTFPI